MRKILSFSLWGSDPKYIDGMRENIRLAAEYYPGWEVWIYAGDGVPNFEGARMTRMHVRDSKEALFWRIHPLFRDYVDIVCPRDADSRIGLRERVAVEEFEQGNYALHVMRDHPAHGTTMLGGMWGARVAGLPAGFREDMDAWVSELLHPTVPRHRYPYEGKFGSESDQPFLQKFLFEKLRPERILVHDDAHGKPFMIPRKDEYDFVGQVHSATGERKYKL